MVVDGVVQGVGFRPFVYNLALGEALVGFVSNSSEGVVIEVEGEAAALERFGRSLQEEAPTLATILSISAREMPTNGDEEFTIRPSQNTPGTRTLIPPDLATCIDCLQELRDSGNRRHHYAFTNCTNCGPRWTIVGRIPYDRPHTSMAAFRMCSRCQDEYDDPGNRRFHAQPNACAVCGPRVWLVDDRSSEVSGHDPLRAVADLLAAGKIVAVKGLGGFHLAVRADREEAVLRLRRRKNREAKPLAVMVSDLDQARQLAHVSEEEAALLGSPAAPIVLVPKHPDGDRIMAAAVAPGHHRLGLMLPSTPLHHLLMAAAREREVEAIILTSGNASDEPICLDNQEAQSRLEGIADAWLLHDRDILRRADDSVVQLVAGHPLFHRRSRGYAPLPLTVNVEAEARVLALGSDLKNVVGLLKDGRVFLSPHVGDLANLQAHEFFEASIDNLQTIFECSPAVIAHDLHPAYFGTRWARGQVDRGCRLVPVQHHHAHLAAVLAEHHHPGPAVGLILDGTGYGTDGTIWGGEILVGNADGYRRAGHLETVPLPGGDAAILSPWRTAVSYLRQAWGDDQSCWPRLPWLDDHPVAAVLEMLRQGVNSPLTSSCGRLFDAVAALTGGWVSSHYEAQAAMELMALTSPAEVASATAWSTALDPAGDDPSVVPVSGLIRVVADSVAAGNSAATISARFHRTLIDMLVEAVIAVSREEGIREVALGGGVFQNDILLAGVVDGLAATGLQPMWPQQVPPGDGGLALGQAVIAARAMVD